MLPVTCVASNLLVSLELQHVQPGLFMVSVARRCSFVLWQEKSVFRRAGVLYSTSSSGTPISLARVRRCAGDTVPGKPADKVGWLPVAVGDHE
jgi:hypothetical protein